MIAVGKVLKAQGIKGEVKIGCYSGDSKQLKHVKQLNIGAKTYKVTSLRTQGEFCYALFDGVCDRNAAEELRNSEVFAEKSALAIENGSYFVEDMVGSSVIVGGKTLGKVTEVLQYGSADVFVCQNDGGKGFSFPFLKDLIVSVNVAVKSLELDAKRFDEVVCYED